MTAFPVSKAVVTWTDQPISTDGVQVSAIIACQCMSRKRLTCRLQGIRAEMRLRLREKGRRFGACHFPKIRNAHKKSGYDKDKITLGSRCSMSVSDGKITITYSAPSGGGSSSSSSGDYTVSVENSKHGTVTVSPKRADKGDTVTITVKPDNGYELDELTVTDKDGDTVKLQSKGGNKYTFTMPGSKVTVEATFTLEKEENLPFADVAEDYWAVEEITWAYENGYMNGVSAERFAPGSTVTRQQLWMVLARLTEFNPSNMTEAQHWAVESKISDGSNPGGALTRQQMVTILYRWAQQMGYDVSGRADLSAFPDNASVAAYATEPMTWAIAEGIISGTTEGLLNPAGTATRAQFAVILYRFFENVM